MAYKEWNRCKPNTFNLMFLGLNGQIGLRLNIKENKVSATDFDQLLRIEIDNKVKLNKHTVLKHYAQKVNKKISAFSGLNTFIPRKQALVIYNAVILWKFNHHPLIWLFCNKGANK